MSGKFRPLFLQFGQVLECFLCSSRQALQYTLPQHITWCGAPATRRQIWHFSLSGGVSTNLQSYPPFLGTLKAIAAMVITGHCWQCALHCKLCHVQHGDDCNPRPFHGSRLLRPSRHFVAFSQVSKLVLFVKAIELACQGLVLLTTWCTTWTVASTMKGAGLCNHNYSVLYYTVIMLKKW